MDGLVSSATSTTSSIIMLVFCLLLLLPSCYRGGRRRELEKWSGWLFPEECSCGFACWMWPATRRPAWFGALLPPMRFLAFLQDPGVRAGWKLRRHQRGSFLQSSLPATQLLCLVFSSGGRRWRCKRWRIALFRDVSMDLVVFSILFRVL